MTGLSPAVPAVMRGNTVDWLYTSWTSCHNEASQQRPSETKLFLKSCLAFISQLGQEVESVCLAHLALTLYNEHQQTNTDSI